jgi:hypothetical protein
MVAALLAVMGCSSGNRTHKTNSISLFNGRNLDGWHTYTSATKFDNPGIFVVEDGLLRINGGDGKRAYYGGIITDDSFENYHLSLEYKFAGPTHGERKNNARDSGIHLHCVGSPEGANWPASIEANIMEGDTGSFWLVGNTRQRGVDGIDDDGNPVKLAIVVEAEKIKNEWYFRPGKPAVSIEGRDRFVNPVFKDTNYTDTLGWRAAGDWDSPFGQWTKVECICRADTIEVYVNGKLANKATQASLTRGRICLQAEAADILYRNIELTPLEHFDKNKSDKQRRNK